MNKKLTQLEENFIQASKMGNLNIVKEAIKQNIDVNVTDEFGRTAFMWAVIWNYYEIAKELIHISDLKIKDNSGRTALQMARTMKNTKIINLFKIEKEKQPIYKEIITLKAELETSKKSDEHHKNLLKKVIHRSQNQQEDLKAADNLVSKINSEKLILQGRLNKAEYDKKQSQIRFAKKIKAANER